MSEVRKVLLVAIGVCLLLGVCAGPASAHQRLPRDLPSVHCSHLRHLHGVDLWKHYARDLFKQEWPWADYIITRESNWHPGAHNPSGASGLAQFMPEWFDGWGCTHWRWNPYDPILCIRVFYYVAHHPGLGGRSNWNL